MKPSDLCKNTELVFGTARKRNQIQGFPGGSVVKNLPANAGDIGLKWHSMLSDYDKIKLETDNNKISRKSSTIWKLSNMLQNNPWVKKKVHIVFSIIHSRNILTREDLNEQIESSPLFFFTIGVNKEKPWA